MRGLGQSTTPLPLAPGGFCPTIPTPCPSGSVLTTDANNCPNYPCSTTAATTTTAATGLTFFTQTDPWIGLPYWVWMIAAAGVFYMVTKK